MLPIALPQITDLLNFESASALPELVPAEAPPVASFSSLLGLAQDLPLPEAGLPGQILPVPGNELPVAAVPTGATEVTIELPESIEDVAVAAALVPAPAVPAVSQAPSPSPEATAASLAARPTSSVPLTSPVSPASPASPEPLLRPAPARPLPQPVGRVALPQPADNLQPDRSLEPPARQNVATTPATPITSAAEPEQVLQRTVAAAPAAPVAQVMRDARLTDAPTPRAAPPDVEADLETLPRAERPAEARPAPAALELRPPVLTGSEIRERMIAAAEPQGPGNAQPLPPAAAGVATPRQPAGEIPTTVMTSSIDTTVTDPKWGDQLAQRVQILASNRLQTAEIRLSPAELGPVRVQISVDDGAATVSFQAQHAVTRDAIEQALPRLREMLAENGLTLTQSSVGEQGGQAGSRESADGGPTRGLAGSDMAADGPLATEASERSREPKGLLDTFA